jgi:hypothetical protein
MKPSFTAAVFTALLAIGPTCAGAAGAQQTSQQTNTSKEQPPMVNQAFADKYVELWKTTDDAQRKLLVDELFAEDAVHYAAPANTSFVGKDQILTNVANVNMGAVQKAGLKFKGGASIPNHNSILVEWSAEAPNGKTVRTGRDLLILNTSGKATALYMFTND